MGHHPENLVKRVGHRIGVAIADHPLLAPRLQGILKGLPRDEQERVVLDLECELGTAALEATFNGGPHG